MKLKRTKRKGEQSDLGSPIAFEWHETKFSLAYSDKRTMKFLCLFIFIFSLAHAEEESEALRALRLSCRQHVALGCYNYANMMLKRDLREEADKYFELGCKLEHSDSCSKKAWENLTQSTPAPLPDTSESPSLIPESAPEEPMTNAPVAATDEATDEAPAEASTVSTNEEAQAESISSEDVPESLTVEESTTSSDDPNSEATELDLSAIE